MHSATLVLAANLSLLLACGMAGIAIAARLAHAELRERQAAHRRRLQAAARLAAGGSLAR